MVTIYCSGSIIKGNASSKGRQVWTDTERRQLADAALPVEVHFFNPDDPIDTLDNTVGLFGRDMYQIQTADFVVVDARERRGIGIGVEMAASKLLHKTLVVVAPTNSYYRSETLSFRGGTVDNYVHPHVQVLADAIVEDFEAAGVWIRESLSKPRHIKGLEAVYGSIEEYKREMLHLDAPMQLVLSLMEESDR